MKTRRATVSFKTVGCRLNQAETAVIRSSFEEAGFATVRFGEPCDVGVIHGCVVTAKAEEDGLRLARSIKRRYPAAFIILAGCAAELLAKRLIMPKRTARPDMATWFCHPEQSEGSRPKRQIADEIPRYARNDELQNINIPVREHTDIDYLAGQKEKFHLPAILGIRFQTAEKQQPATVPLFNTQRAIVKIQDGCDGRCAYCIVPHVRGTSRSRPANEIIEEISRLTRGGFPEIILTGANIGSYLDGQCRLPQLLEKVEAIPSLQRFRISSLEIVNVNLSSPDLTRPSQSAAADGIGSGIQENSPVADRIPASRLRVARSGGRRKVAGMIAPIREIINFMASSKKMCHFLHLPLQSGSDSILKAMERPYTAGEFSAVVQYAQEKLGTFGLGTDVIVGFPGETGDDFLATEQIIRQLPFSKLHVFSYSPRPGTSACRLPAQVSLKDMKMRAARLIELGRQKRKEFVQSLTGKQARVLVEKVTPDGWAEGWTGEYIRARIQSRGLKPKQIVEFTIEHTAEDVLLGKIKIAGGIDAGQ